MKQSQIISLQKELRDKKRIVSCAHEFGVIGDPTRLKICYLLCNYPELSVSEIADALSVSISVVSHSLAKLRKIGFVKRRKFSQTIYYSCCSAPLPRLLKDYLKVI